MENQAEFLTNFANVFEDLSKSLINLIDDYNTNIFPEEKQMNKQLFMSKTIDNSDLATKLKQHLAVGKEKEKPFSNIDLTREVAKNFFKDDAIVEQQPGNNFTDFLINNKYSVKIKIRTNGDVVNLDNKKRNKKLGWIDLDKADFVLFVNPEDATKVKGRLFKSADLKKMLKVSRYPEKVSEADLNWYSNIVAKCSPRKTKYGDSFFEIVLK